MTDPIKKNQIDELIDKLNTASAAYYNGLDELMSNYEWDELFDQLVALEEETNYVRTDSPTKRAGFETTTGEREVHEFPALSLAKTKLVSDLQKWAEDKAIYLSWKLDGLTLVLTYDHGKLSKILTRGNGTTGNNITYMKDVIKGIPLTIEDKGHLVVRGEAAISYTDFERINELIEEDDDKYANPRNLASGTLALDVTNIDKVKDRHIYFYAFTLVYLEKEINSWGERMNYLESLGFYVVERERTNQKGMEEVVKRWTQKVESKEMDLPVDGLVICYEDTAYAATGSVTGHHATRSGYAFKWEDVAAETMLLKIEWSCAASTISPVAIFEPVQLEGTTVSRASLCNLSEMERLGIGEEDTIVSVIKSNKIIPKVIKVIQKKGTFKIPANCPVCGEATEIKVSPKSETKTLHCTNPDCTAKYVKKFTRFVSKTGMDIDGLSIQTMIKFMNLGYIKQFSDIYHLSEYQEEIKQLEGFGEKSCENMMQAIENSRKVHPIHLMYALCIPLLGVDAGKKIINKTGTKGFIERMINGTGFEDIDGIGPEKSNSIMEWYQQDKNKDDFHKLLALVFLEEVRAKEDITGLCNGLTFVITGEVSKFKNRGEFKSYVEEQGGSVTGSVSKKTNYLINNDHTSESSKNKKAKELNIPILTEEEFLAKFKEKM